MLGSLVTERGWDDALAEAVRAPNAFCIQERFRVRPVAFSGGPLYPAYLVNGRFAGYDSLAAGRPPHHPRGLPCGDAGPWVPYHCVPLFALGVDGARDEAWAGSGRTPALDLRP